MPSSRSVAFPLRKKAQRMELAAYSIGLGDRFGREGPAQLDAVIEAAQRGVQVTPVWNKSWREHQLTGSRPADVRQEADQAVAARGWSGAWFVDADHVTLESVDAFLQACDFFTLDVAEQIGRPTDPQRQVEFARRHHDLLGRWELPGAVEPLEITRASLEQAAACYLGAVEQSGRIYRHICTARPPDSFLVELSLDETTQPQAPAEMLLILAAAADEEIPVRLVAPRFCGKFLKGVDYVGDVERFSCDFAGHAAVLRFAVEQFGLPAGLKLSIHSGSDKFSLYPVMHQILRRQEAGVHLKTAGTTWLEELGALAEVSADGLAAAREIYSAACERIDELWAPYATVVEIDQRQLPSPAEVARWDGAEFARALRHDPSCAAFNPHVRQLLHVAFRIAAEMGQRFTDLLHEHAAQIGPRVTENLSPRHIRPLFLGE